MAKMLSLKEKREIEKQKKQNKLESRMDKKVFQPPKGDRNKLDAKKQTAKKIQMGNLNMIFSSPKISQEISINSQIKLLQMLDDMRYTCTQDLADHSEIIIKTIQRMTAFMNQKYPFFDDSICQATCHDAANAVNFWVKNFDNLSPNERDQVLLPLRELFNAYIKFLDSLPPSMLISEPTTYAAATQVLGKTMKFLELEMQIINAIGQVINGEDSRKIARSINMPYAEFSDRILHAANLLYTVGLAEESEAEKWHGKPLNAVRPKTMKDVRQPMFKWFMVDIGVNITNAVRDSEDFIMTCDNAVGISSMNWVKHRDRRAKLRSIARKEAENAAAA